MQREEIEVYSCDSNYAIVTPPGRNFPGCVIQGDSLSVLCRLTLGLVKAVKQDRADTEEFRSDLEDLNNALVGRLLHYQQVLAAHGLELPYCPAFSDSDFVRFTAADEADS